jgi:hypothetical protein
MFIVLYHSLFKNPAAAFPLGFVHAHSIGFTPMCSSEIILLQKVSKVEQIPCLKGIQ